MPAELDAYFRKLDGLWYSTRTGQQTAPHEVAIGEAFLIWRWPGGGAFEFGLSPADAAPVFLPKALGNLREGDVRRFPGTNFAFGEDVCASVVVGDRLTTLHTLKSTSDSLSFRVGKVFDRGTAEGLLLARGKSTTTYPADTLTGMTFDKAITTFVGGNPSFVPYPADGGKLEQPRLREGEQRITGVLEDGELRLGARPGAFEPGTLIEVDFAAELSDGRKVAVHIPQLRLNSETTSSAAIAEIAEAISAALADQGVAARTRISLGVDRDFSVSLGFAPATIVRGKFDACFLTPPPAPVIDVTALDGIERGLVTDGIIVARGTGFGDRAQDLCLQLVDPTGEKEPIPVKALAILDKVGRADGRARPVLRARGRRMRCGGRMHALPRADRADRRQR